ncbi:MAG: oligopeptide/dipeptide ABC transporter ATP-binding protein, partial [Actinomycetota bacterium]
LITHDLGVVSQVCDRVAIMYAGKMFELARAAELFENPQNPYTLALLRSLPDVERKKERVEPIEGTVPDLLGEQEGCLFAPRCPEVIDECRRTEPALVQLPRELVGERAQHLCRCLRREPART